MPGHRNFNELRGELAATIGEDRLAASERAEADRYEAEQLRLADVRRARALTQTQLARALGVSQAQVSRIETQSDLFLSTLASYIEAMGGELQLVAAFGDQRLHLEIGDTAARAAAQAADATSDEPIVPVIAAEAAPAERPIVVRQESATPHRDLREAELRSRGVIEEDEQLVGVDLSPLSARQRAVLDHIAAGTKVSDVAEALGISNETVRGHLRAAMDQLKLPREARIISDPRGTVWGVFRQASERPSDVSLN